MHAPRLAVCHPDEAARAGVAARLRGAAVESWDPGQPRPECDAVFFAGPVLPSAGVVEQLLAAGVHVLIAAEECPTAEVFQSLTAARATGTLCAVVNPDRFLPSRQLIRRQLGNSLGEPGLIRLHRWEPADTTSPAEPDRLPDPLVRDIDLTLWLAGSRPDRVFALEPPADSGRTIQLHLGFPNGGMALLDFTNRLPPGDGYQSLSVIASTGAAYADDHQNGQLVYGGGNPRAIRTEERAGQLAGIAQCFLDAVGASRDPAADTNWSDVFTVAAAVRESLASRRAVALEGR